jgi:phosphoribosylformylglycinamidine synthase
MPIAHGEGCYFADDATLDQLERDGQVLFRYVHADGTPAAPRRPGEPERQPPRDRRRR